MDGKAGNHQPDAQVTGEPKRIGRRTAIKAGVVATGLALEAVYAKPTVVSAMLQESLVISLPRRKRTISSVTNKAATSQPVTADSPDSLLVETIDGTVDNAPVPGATPGPGKTGGQSVASQEVKGSPSRTPAGGQTSITTKPAPGTTLSPPSGSQPSTGTVQSTGGITSKPAPATTASQGTASSKPAPTTKEGSTLQKEQSGSSSKSTTSSSKTESGPKTTTK